MSAEFSSTLIGINAKAWRSALSATTAQEFELKGEKSALGPMLRSLFHSRDLLRALAKKNFVANYRRASLGMLWAVGLPLIEAAVLALVFSSVLKLRASGGRNFAVFIFAGVLPWSYFLGTLSASVSSIVGGSNLSTRIYFPRAIFPLIHVRSNLYGFAPGVLVLLAMALIFGVDPGVHNLLLIPAVIILVLLTASFSLVFAAAQVYFRDVRWIVQAITRPWFYASGVFFALDRLSPPLQAILRINPAVGVLQMFRAGTIGGDNHWELAVWWTLGWIAVLFTIAALVYQRYDRVFPDRL
jgi:lipopolysaccharide transport system permease protein